MIVRDLQERDWPQVWTIIEPVARAGDTFPYPTDLTEEQARAVWLDSGPRGRVAVAVGDDEQTIVGTAKMGPNRPGPGRHVATASYMVRSGLRGKGVGRALVVDSLAWVRANGYAAMQFNAVVEENVGAVRSTRSWASGSSGPCAGPRAARRTPGGTAHHAHSVGLTPGSERMAR